METQTFAVDLQRLRDELLALGDMVERAVAEAVELLKQRNLADLQCLTALDREIRHKRLAIELDCLTRIISQEPLDGELRAIASILEIAMQLERVGECVCEVVRMPFVVIDGPAQSLLADLYGAATEAQAMLHDAMKAFAREGAAPVEVLPGANGQVGAPYRRVREALATYLRGDARAKGDSQALVMQARYVVRVARILERVDDQVAAIREWVVYAKTGEMGDPVADALPG